MLNYLKKFALEIMPSVAATVIGAYIVNHYVSRPAADAPVTAVAPAHSRKEAKPAHGGAEIAGIPGHGVKAKGISERALMEKAAAEKPAEVKPIELKGAEAKPAETASIPADSRHHATASASREKAMAKVAPPAASPAAPVETAAAPATAEEHRDANDLARAAIERLRNEDSQRTQEALRTTQEALRAPEAPRLQEGPRTVTPPPATAAVHPLPPPITVTVPPVEAPTATAAIPNDDPNRPIPPADIPPPPPIDLKADADKLATRTTNMAQDMLHAARSMFHAVLPGSTRQDSSGASQFTD